MANWDWTTPHKCPICKKDFWVTSRREWAYKRDKKDALVFLCSWKCLRKYDEKAEIERTLRRSKNAQHSNGNCSR